MLIPLSVLLSVLLIVQSVSGLTLHRSKREAQHLQVKASYNLNHPPSVESYIPVSVVYDDEEDTHVLSKSIQQNEAITEKNGPTSINKDIVTNIPYRALQPKALYANHPPIVEDYNPISADNDEDINVKSVTKIQDDSYKRAISFNVEETAVSKDPSDVPADIKSSVDELDDNKGILNKSADMKSLAEQLTGNKSLSYESPTIKSPSEESSTVESLLDESDDVKKSSEDSSSNKTTISDIIPKGRSIKLENDSTTVKIPRRKQSQRRRLHKENKVTTIPQTEKENKVTIIDEKTKNNTGNIVQKEVTSSENDKNVKSTTNTNFQRRTEPRDPVVPIIESENYVFAYNGDFHYSYEGGDGTKAFERGELKSVEDGSSGTGVVGGFSYKDKDGNDFSLSYTADENGYRPVGAHLPTPPPIPLAIQRALALLATKTTPEPITERVNKYD